MTIRYQASQPKHQRTNIQYQDSDNLGISQDILQIVLLKGYRLFFIFYLGPGLTVRAERGACSELRALTPRVESQPYLKVVSRYAREA